MRGVGVAREDDASVLVGSEGVDGDKATALRFTDHDAGAVLQTPEGATQLAFLGGSTGKE